MNWNSWIRQSHRWLSIAFTVTVIANFVALAQGGGTVPPWITYSPLVPLALLLITGLGHRDIDDLGLDLVAPSDVRARNLPRLAVQLLRGARPRPGLIVLPDTQRAVIRCDLPLPLQVDGEDLGDVEVAVFESEPDAVTALVPS